MDLNNRLKNIKDVLSTSEMKQIFGGKMAQISCNVGGQAVACDYPTLLWCTERCSELHGNNCGGCYQVIE